MDTKTKGVEKYLTEMKELSDYSDEGKNFKNEAPKPPLPKPTKKKAIEAVRVPKAVSPPPEAPVSQPKEIVIEETESSDLEEPEKKENFKNFSTKDVILAVVNVVSLVLLFILLAKLPTQAREMNTLRNESSAYDKNIGINLPDISSSQEKADRLTALFLDESGVVDFVSEVEKIKAESGRITKITFASQVASKDRTGNLGVPVIIELEGPFAEVKGDLLKLESLPFLFRPASIEIEPLETDPALTTVKYGGFLYVNDKLGQTR